MAHYNDPNPVPFCMKTFQVNLETVNRQGQLVPDRTQLDGNETVAEADNFKNTRSTWLPDLKLANHVLKHGDTFDVSGKVAYDLKAKYVSNPPAVDDVLIVVSES